MGVAHGVELWYLGVWSRKVPSGMVLTGQYGTDGHGTCVAGTDWALWYWGVQVMQITCD